MTTAHHVLDDRFTLYTVTATPNRTAGTVEIRLITEAGWLAHLAPLSPEQAKALQVLLGDALDDVVAPADREASPGPQCSRRVADVRRGSAGVASSSSIDTGAGRGGGAL